MKIETKILKPMLEKAAKLASRRTTLPILNCVRLSASQGKLEVEANDLDFAISMRGDCEGELEPVCVYASKLVPLVQCAGESVTLVIDGPKIKLIGNFEATLSYFKGEELPPFPSGMAKAHGINCEELANGIEAVGWAVADAEDPRFNFQGISVVSESKKLFVYALDGRKCGLWNADIIGSKTQFIFPAKFVDLLCEVLMGETPTMQLTENHLIASCQSATFACKLMDVGVPDVQKFFTATVQRLNGVDLGAIKTALSCINSLSKDKMFTPCDFDYKTGKMVISFEEEDSSFTSQLDCETEFKSFRLNAHLALEVISKRGEDSKMVLLPEGSMVAFESGNYTCGLAWLKLR